MARERARQVVPTHDGRVPPCAGRVVPAAAAPEVLGMRVATWPAMSHWPPDRAAVGQSRARRGHTGTCPARLPAAPEPGGNRPTPPVPCGPRPRRTGQAGALDDQGAAIRKVLRAPSHASARKAIAVRRSLRSRDPPRLVVERCAVTRAVVRPPCLPCRPGGRSCRRGPLRRRGGGGSGVSHADRGAVGWCVHLCGGVRGERCRPRSRKNCSYKEVVKWDCESIITSRRSTVTASC